MFVKNYRIEYSNSLRIHSLEAGIKRWLKLSLFFLLEYLNLAGFPAGIIMPLAGVVAARGEINFFLTIAISVGAGL